MRCARVLARLVEETRARAGQGWSGTLRLLPVVRGVVAGSKEREGRGGGKNLCVERVKSAALLPCRPIRPSRSSLRLVTPRPQLDGQSGALIWGEQFGSGADDEAVALMLGPETSSTSAAAAATVDPDVEGTGGSPEQDATGGSGGNPLYLTGWTRGALFSKVPGKANCWNFLALAAAAAAAAQKQFSSCVRVRVCVCVPIIARGLPSSFLLPFGGLVGSLLLLFFVSYCSVLALGDCFFLKNGRSEQMPKFRTTVVLSIQAYSSLQSAVARDPQI